MKATLPIAEAPLAVRTKAALQQAGFRRMGDVRNLSDAALLQIPHFSRACLEDLQACLDTLFAPRWRPSGKGRP